MRLGESRTTRTVVLAIAALVFSFGIAHAQTDDGSGDTTVAPSVQPDQPNPAQQAHDDADAAQSALDAATQARDQLESDGAPQEQIDSANDAVARARADKEAADNAAQQADEAASH